MNEKTVLILGCGVGGIVAANSLRKKQGAKYNIVVIDKNDFFLFPSHLWVLTGDRTKEQITKPLSMLKKSSFNAKRNKCFL